MSSDGVSLSRSDYAFGGAPYPFIEPHLYALGIGSSGPGKVITAVFALDYQTGKVEKQIICTVPGMITLTHRNADSLYASVLKLGMSIRPGASQAALLRFGFDLNLRAARTIRNAEPRWPAVRPYRNGQLLCSYSYAEAKTVVVETTDETFESGTPSCFLDKANYSVARSNFVMRPAELNSSPLNSITVKDAKSRTSEADVSLVPLDLKAVPCNKQQNMQASGLSTS